MDMRLFEKSPQVAPLLVRLYDSHRLYELAQDDSPLARAELTNAVVDLLQTQLGPREKELIADVLISLMRQAEQDLRQALAERLALVETAPLRVILHLANDDIDVAAPMLRLSRVFSDLDLLYIIKSKGPEYWRAIAARDTLSDGVMNVLADTKEQGTLETLVSNKNLRLTPHALTIMEQSAEKSESLARPLLMRPEVPENLARKLYQHVGDDLKEYIRGYFGIIDDAAIHAIDDVIFEFSEQKSHVHTQPESREFMPRESAIKAADVLASSGRLTMQYMMGALQRGQMASFIAMFARFSGLGVDRIHEMLSATDGKMLAVTCRAIGLTKSDLSRIYMMTQRIRSTGRIVDQADLLRTLAVYDRVEKKEARKILGFSD